MTENTTPEPFPHVKDWQRDIIAKHGHLLNNTGGNDPLDLINDLSNPKNERMAATNVVRFTLAVAVQSQVTLLAQMEKAGLLADEITKARAERITPGDWVIRGELDSREVARVSEDEVWLYFFTDEPQGPFPLDNYTIVRRREERVQ